MYVVMKILISAGVIAAVTEIAKRFPSFGGLIAALPLVSLLSIIWLYVQGEQTKTLSKFALGVLSGFPATAVLLFIVYVSLKQSLSLMTCLGLGISGWIVCILLQEVAIKFIKTII
ncbi:multidrug efflux pump subunit AcrB [Fictibacillus halophilus]|uniref:Multidrug efflux pump subunit AcrB n=1 Tax=Fictibacillus halophilus TaxID=1610490 RepID=A0ABV2LJS9_9BACL|nr:DUF3147 family protein [Fictibacillus halophilus]